MKKITFLILLLLAIFITRNQPNPFSKSQIPENEMENEQEPITTARAGIASTSHLLSNYKNIGPHYAGRILCLLIDISDTSHLIAGTSTGGLWASYNSAQTWEPIQDQFYPMNVNSISQNPLQPNMIYCSTGVPQTDSLGVSRVDILQSIDYGHTFHYLTANSPVNMNFSKVVCSRTDPNTIYAMHNVTGPGTCVFRSTNNGATFQQVTSNFLPAILYDLEALPNGKIIFSVGNNIYVSTTGDSGTFVNSSTGFPPSALESHLAFCESNPDIIYAKVEGSNVLIMYKSIDGGGTWTYLDSVTSGTWGAAIGVKPDDPNVVLCGAVGFFASTDGNTFNQWQALGVDFWSVNFNPLNPSEAYVTYDGGVGKAIVSPFNPDPYQVQYPCDSLLVCSQEYAGDGRSSGDSWIAGFQDLGTAFKSNNGSTYNVYGADGGYCFFHHTDSAVAYASWQNGGIVRDNDIYNPWSTSWVEIMNQLDSNNDRTIDEGVAFINPFKMLPSNSDVLFYPTQKHLWRSVDRGDNWMKVSDSYSTTAAMYIDVSNGINPTVFWKYDDTLCVLLNAITAAPGSELKIKLPCTSIAGVFSHPTNDTTVFVSMCGYVYKSSGLASGTPQWISLGTSIINYTIPQSFAIDPQNENFMVAGGLEGCFVTTNGGSSWSRENGIPPVRITRIQLRDSDRKLFFFTYGRGTWNADLPVITGLDAQAEIPKTYFRIRNNPFSEDLEIQFSELKSNESLEIFSAQGVLIESIVLGQKENLNVRTSELADGVYIIVMKDKEKIIQTLKVIKQS